MQHVISIGGGLSSTMELPERVIDCYGSDNVELIMCRLPNEDKDVWRLVKAVEKRFDKTVWMIGLGLTPHDIFFQERFLGNSRVDPCSRVLKREVLARYMDDHYPRETTVMHVGVTFEEVDRMLAITENWRKKGWVVDAPLANDPSITRQYLMDKCDRLFGFVPRLYKMGMSHNNCGGACIKAGHAQWARLLWFLPEVYRWWEEMEIRFQNEIGFATILTEGRDKHPLTLTAFRIRMQDRWGNMLPGMEPFDGLEETRPCVFCEAA